MFNLLISLLLLYKTINLKCNSVCLVGIFLFLYCLDLNPLRDSNQDIAEEGSDEEENASDEEGSGRWPPEAIDSLIKHTKVYWKDLQDGLRKKKDIWEDICMAMVSEGHIVTSSECNKKFRNMKVNFDVVIRLFNSLNLII